MPHKEEIDKRIAAELKRERGDSVTARRIFSFDNSVILDSHRDDWFTIAHAVAERFSIPIRKIYLSGSAHVGYSYFKKQNFGPEILI